MKYTVLSKKHSCTQWLLEYSQAIRHNSQFIGNMGEIKEHIKWQTKKPDKSRMWAVVASP